jgi:hypothetical protein
MARTGGRQEVRSFESCLAKCRRVLRLYLLFLGTRLSVTLKLKTFVESCAGHLRRPYTPTARI